MTIMKQIESTWKKNKWFFLFPMIFLFVLFILVILLTNGPAVAPFVYAIF
jgi:hypothetical protein